MNKLQKQYLDTKVEYDHMLKFGTEADFDEACDYMLDAEEALVDWALKIAEASKKIPPADLETLRRNWRLPNWYEKMIDLALKLNEPA